MLQPEHGFCQRNGPEPGQLQEWLVFKGKQIFLEPRRNSKYPIRYFLPSAIWTQAYSEPLQASKMECFCVNSQHLKVVNWIRENAPSWMFEGVLNMPLLKNKAGVSCAKRTLNATSECRLRNMCFQIFQWY